MKEITGHSICDNCEKSCCAFILVVKANKVAIGARKAGAP